MYKDGKLDGESLSYHEYGQLKTRANFRDGKRKGILEEFNEDGSVKNDN
jgi:antitoxin component YwqK of YwqJK toxin-antitoxin module